MGRFSSRFTHLPLFWAHSLSFCLSVVMVTSVLSHVGLSKGEFLASVFVSPSPRIYQIEIEKNTKREREREREEIARQIEKQREREK